VRMHPHIASPVGCGYATVSADDSVLTNPTDAIDDRHLSIGLS